MSSSEDALQRRIRHLEARIAGQRRTITALQTARRIPTARSRGWWEGREALLQRQVQTWRDLFYAKLRDEAVAKALAEQEKPE